METNAPFLDLLKLLFCFFCLIISQFCINSSKKCLKLGLEFDHFLSWILEFSENKTNCVTDKVPVHVVIIQVPTCVYFSESCRFLGKFSERFVNAACHSPHPARLSRKQESAGLTAARPPSNTWSFWKNKNIDFTKTSCTEQNTPLTVCGDGLGWMVNYESS